MDRAGRCTPPVLAERRVYLLALFRPAEAAGAHPPAPEPRHSGRVGKNFMDGLGDYLQKVPLISVYRMKA